DAGRVDALLRAHTEQYSKPPTVSADKHAQSESPTPLPQTADGLARVRYVPIDLPPASSPWRAVVAFPLDAGFAPRPDEVVSFSVAVHRALIARIGLGAAPEI